MTFVDFLEELFDLFITVGLIFLLLLQFLWNLGVPADEVECCDVYGLDDELLEMVPKPVFAVLFLYPLTAKVPSTFEVPIIC